MNITKSQTPKSVASPKKTVPQKQSPPLSTALKKATSAGVGAAICTTLLLPMQSAIVLSQARFLPDKSALAAIFKSSNPWNGYSGALNVVVQSRALSFALIELLAKQTPAAWDTDKKREVSAFGAAIGKSVAIHPWEIVKKKMQTQGHIPQEYTIERGIFHTVSTIFKHEGFLGIYKGMQFSIYKSMLGIPLWLYLKNNAERAWDTQFETPLTEKEKLFKRAICGGTAGIVSQLAVYPLDVYRAMRMLNRVSHTTSTQSTVITLLKEHGLKRFASGARLQIAFGFSSGIIFNTVESLVHDKLSREL